MIGMVFVVAGPLECVHCAYTMIDMALRRASHKFQNCILIMGCQGMVESYPFFLMLHKSGLMQFVQSMLTWQQSTAALEVSESFRFTSLYLTSSVLSPCFTLPLYFVILLSYAFHVMHIAGQCVHYDWHGICCCWAAWF
jgi:hypothetical protein